MPSLKFALVPSIALLALTAHAQTPSYTGALLIEPLLNNGKCMTAASNNDGAIVTIQGCTGADAQKWTFNGGSVKIFGNKCLDVTDGNNVDGVKLQIWTCNVPNANQQFFYTSDYHLAWTDHGKCLDLTDGNQSDGNRPQLWTCSGTNPNQVWNTGYMANALPQTSENGQSGTNNCGSGSSQSSNCQTAWINDVDDFCLWAPPNPSSTIGDTEREEVAWCTKSGRGTRTIPDGALKGVHFVKTPDYVQVTGVGDFTKINIRAGDAGGELDPHGADGNGNPIGGLVFGNTFGAARQYHEWTSFISDTEFCFRACVGPNAARNCQHIYDVMGCFWNMPANYDAGTFESCDADDDLPMGIYGTSTWFQGVNPTPPAHPAASSSNCRTLPTVSVGPAARRRDNGGLAPTDYPIETVTVFKSNAEVIRTFDLELKASQNCVEISEIPSCIEPNTVRVSGLSSNARLFDVFSTIAPTTFTGLGKDKFTSQILENIRLLEANKAELVSQQQIFRHEADILVSWGKSLSGDHIKPGDIQAAMSQFVDVSKRNVSDSQAIEEKIVALNREIAALKRKQEERKGLVSSKITIIIGSEGEGDDSVSLRLSYVVSSSAWKPMYELHASTNRDNSVSDIALNYCAHITQSTGEDWSGSSLILSAAEVGQTHHTIPTLYPLKVRPMSTFAKLWNQPQAPVTSIFSSFGGQPPQPQPPASSLFGSSATSNTATTPSMPVPPPDPEEDAYEVINESLKPSTTITETPLSVSYTVPGPATIPSDGMRHQVPIASLSFDADPSHVIVPRITPVVYLQCRIKNTSDYKLLPGTVNVVMDGSYVTSFAIKEVNKGDTFDCTLGADPGIKVNYARKNSSARKDESAFTEALNVVTYSNKLTLTNTHSYALNKLIVKECLPLTGEHKQAKIILKQPMQLVSAGEGEVALPVTMDACKSITIRWSEVVDGKGGEKDGMFEWCIDEFGEGEKVEFDAEWEFRTPGGTQWVEYVYEGPTKLFT